jgi:hypothetical protein
MIYKTQFTHLPMGTDCVTGDGEGHSGGTAGATVAPCAPRRAAILFYLFYLSSFSPGFRKQEALDESEATGSTPFRF